MRCQGVASGATVTSSTGGVRRGSCSPWPTYARLMRLPVAAAGVAPCHQAALRGVLGSTSVNTVRPSAESSTALFHRALGKPVDVEQLVRLLDGVHPQDRPETRPGRQPGKLSEWEIGNCAAQLPWTDPWSASLAIRRGQGGNGRGSPSFTDPGGGSSKGVCCQAQAHVRVPPRSPGQCPGY